MVQSNDAWIRLKLRSRRRKRHAKPTDSMSLSIGDAENTPITQNCFDRFLGKRNPPADATMQVPKHDARERRQKIRAPFASSLKIYVTAIEK